MPATDGGAERAAESWPRVSVVVPVYNGAAALARCLQALQAQDYPAGRLQVLVVDNASTEDLSGAVPTDPRFSLLHESRRGSYAARNTGVAAARGEVLAFTDADCIPRPDWLRQGTAALSGGARSDAVGGAIQIVFGDGRGPRTGAEHFEALHEFQQRKYIEQWSFAATANVLAWRTVFDRIGAFDPALQSGGDTDWGNRLVAAGHSLTYAPQAIVEHPARGTWRELGRKSLRVAGGIADRTGHLGGRHLLRRAVREAKSGVAIWWRVWDGSRPAPAGRLAKLRYAVAFSYVHALRTSVHAGRLLAAGARRATRRRHR